MNSRNAGAHFRAAVSRLQTSAFARHRLSRRAARRHASAEGSRCRFRRAILSPVPSVGGDKTEAHAAEAR